MRNRRLTLLAPLFTPAGVPGNLEELDSLWSADFVLAVVEGEATPGIAQRLLVMGRLLERCDLTSKGMDVEESFFTTTDVPTARICMRLIARLEAVREHIRHLRSTAVEIALLGSKEEELCCELSGVWDAVLDCLGSVVQDLRLHVLECVELSEILEPSESGTPRISLKGNE